jgi:hypothetical protein
MFNLAIHAASAFTPNYSEFPNSWLWLQFALGINAFQVLVYGWHGDLEKVGDKYLGEPYCLILETALDARVAILGLIEDQLRRAGVVVMGFHRRSFVMRQVRKPR